MWFNALETRSLRGGQIEVSKILNVHENVDRNIFSSLQKDSRTRGPEVTLVKDQYILDIRKYSFSQTTINEWNKLSTDCVTVSRVNIFKTRLTLDKPMASLSTCHLGLCFGWQSC